MASGVADRVAAAVGCARALGLPCDGPVVLRATHHTVVLLPPSGLVAKVAADDGSRLGREIHLAARLAAAGAPVVPPAARVPATVHRWGGCAMTFWPYLDQEGAAEPGDGAVAQALAALHRALERIDPGPVPWPRFDARARRVAERLGDPAFAPALGAPDRDLLRRTLARALDALRAAEPPEARLHGSPHGLNILMDRGTGRFIDFEEACLGPREWDLAHHGPEVAALYPTPTDPAALVWCRLLVSATTAALCWDGLDSGPDMRWHAEHHLERVRRHPT